MEPVPVPSPARKMYWLPIHQYILDLFLDWSVHQYTSPKYILIHNFLNKNYVKSTFLLTCLYKGMIDKNWEIKT